ALAVGAAAGVFDPGAVGVVAVGAAAGALDPGAVGVVAHAADGHGVPFPPEHAARSHAACGVPRVTMSSAGVEMRCAVAPQAQPALYAGVLPNDGAHPVVAEGTLSLELTEAAECSGVSGSLSQVSW